MYEKLDYIAARKLVYLREYCRLVKNKPKFTELQKRLTNGENLLIIEVDGPHGEDIEYYKNRYNVNNDFIDHNTMIANENNLHIMINDSKHPFGHGYCLAAALLDLADTLMQ